MEKYTAPTPVNTTGTTIVEQDLHTLPDHLSSPLVFCEVRVVVDNCRRCIVCPSIYGFLLPLWYLHLLIDSRNL
jgi:hypothetical protein